MICVLSRFLMPTISKRVVFTLWLTAEIFLPTNVLSRVLFPELGAPQSPTRSILVLIESYIK